MPPPHSVWGAPCYYSPERRQSAVALKGGSKPTKGQSPRYAAGLPIAALLPEVVSSLRAEPNLVLEAPPGAGKTTTVPLALLRDDGGAAC